jgi:hypothetical protein
MFHLSNQAHQPVHFMDDFGFFAAKRTVKSVNPVKTDVVLRMTAKSGEKPG